MTRKERRQLRRLTKQMRRTTRLIREIGEWAERENAKLRAYLDTL